LNDFQRIMVASAPGTANQQDGLFAPGKQAGDQPFAPGLTDRFPFGTIGSQTVQVSFHRINNQLPVVGTGSGRERGPFFAWQIGSTLPPACGQIQDIDPRLGSVG